MAEYNGRPLEPFDGTRPRSKNDRTAADCSAIGRLHRFQHEGIAASNSQWVVVEGTVLRHNNQGVGAGYGRPAMTVRDSVIVEINNRIDPAAPITSAIRFGDGYDGRNGDYLGQVTASSD